jgi:hypothetical protein
MILSFSSVGYWVFPSSVFKRRFYLLLHLFVTTFDYIVNQFFCLYMGLLLCSCAVVLIIVTD